MFKKITIGLAAFACLMAAGELRAAPGDLDLSFDGDGVALIDFSGTDDFALAVQALEDGGILVGGGTDGMNGILALALLDASGGLDSSFSEDGRFTTDPTQFGYSIRDLGVQPDGQFLAAGSITPDMALLRLDTNGTLDASFSGGLVTVNAGGFGNHTASVLLQPDGKIVIAGDESDRFLLARFNADGTPDTGFSEDGLSAEAVPGGGVVTLSRILLDGDRIIAFGRTSTGNDLVIARYESGGDLDLSFDGDGFDTYDAGGLSLISDAVRLPDGKFLIGGEFNTDLGLVRLNADLTLDTGFGVGGTLDHDFPAVTNENLSSLAVQADGKIVGAGASGSGLAQVAMVVRFNADGTIDTGFGVGGLVSPDFLPGSQNNAHAISLQTDGKIVVAGAADGADTDFGVARLIGDEADLSLSKEVDDAEVEVGATVTFTLTVSHASGAEVGGVQVSDTLPAGLTFVSATSSQGTCSGTTTITCDLGTMNPTDEATVTVITTAAAAGTAVNTALVSAQAVDTDSANNEASVSVTVTAPPAPPPAPSTSGGCSLVR